MLGFAQVADRAAAPPSVTDFKTFIREHNAGRKLGTLRKTRK